MLTGLEIALIIGFAILFVWLLILSILYFNSVKHYKRLSIGEGQSYEDAFETIFRNIAQMHSKHESAVGILGEMRETTAKHIQKVVLKRFNPFGDAGGDQSFTLALLDKKGSGVVLSSLHGRSGTRVYAKPVKEGKELSYDLSDEEREVISLAIKE